MKVGLIIIKCNENRFIVHGSLNMKYLTDNFTEWTSSAESWLIQTVEAQKYASKDRSDKTLIPIDFKENDVYFAVIKKEKDGKFKCIFLTNSKKDSGRYVYELKKKLITKDELSNFKYNTVYLTKNNFIREE